MLNFILSGLEKCSTVTEFGLFLHKTWSSWQWEPHRPSTSVNDVVRCKWLQMWSFTDVYDKVFVCSAPPAHCQLIFAPKTCTLDDARSAGHLASLVTCEYLMHMWHILGCGLIFFRKMRRLVKKSEWRGGWRKSCGCVSRRVHTVRLLQTDRWTVFIVTWGPARITASNKIKHRAAQVCNRYGSLKSGHLWSASVEQAFFRVQLLFSLFSEMPATSPV